MEEKMIPKIEIMHSWFWDCPACEASNETEYNGDGFNLPLVCLECGKSFNDYEYEK